MQRYNPVYDAVDRLIQSQAAGRAAARYFENYASDENLPPEHWFWDRRRAAGSSSSMACTSSTCSPAGWGPARSWRPSAGIRPGSSPPIEEHVQCTVRYGPTVLVNFYHGFHQTGRMDRQELRLVFERGDVTLYDWVPTRVRDPRDRRRGRHPRLLRALPRRAARRLRELRRQGPSLPGPPQDARRLPDDRALLGRRNQQVAPLRRTAPGVMADQLAWIRDRSHARKITEAQRPRFAGRRLRGRPAGPGLIRSYGEGAEHDLETTVRAVALKSGRSRALARRFRGGRGIQPGAIVSEVR